MRQLTLPWKIPILVVAVIAAAFHYYCAGFGSPEPRTFRGLHLSMLLPFVYLLYPAWKKSPLHRPSVIDLLAAALCLVASLYTVFYADRLNQRFVGFHPVRPEEVVLGGLLSIAVIEACRRSISKWFAATVGITLIYLMTCQYWPGMFHYKPFTLDRAVGPQLRARPRSRPDLHPSARRSVRPFPPPPSSSPNSACSRASRR